MWYTLIMTNQKLRPASSLPVCKEMCKSCPFRKNSEYEHLLPLVESTLFSASRICHSTGTNALKGATGLPSRLCRGSRDKQIKWFHFIGFIEAPTDRAWMKKTRQLAKIEKSRGSEPV